MKRLYLKALLAMAVGSACLSANAQEKVTKITPLKITSGLNADVIAEKKATETNDYTKTGNENNTLYVSNYATFIDQDTESGGRNAFYGERVESSGAIKVTAVKDHNDYYYLSGNSDKVDYLMQNVNTTGNNALKLVKGGVTEATLEFATIDGSALPAASTLYVVATSAEGTSNLTVTVYGKEDMVLGTTTAAIGDWWSNHNDAKLNEILKVGRITVKGNSTDGSRAAEMNYVNNAQSTTSGYFCLQRISVSTLSSTPVTKIKITKASTDDTHSCAVIFAATAVTEEVTLKDSESSLNYLKNETTQQRIAETVKAKVNLERTFHADNSDGTPRWQPFVFCCELTAKQAKTMFGNNIKVSVAENDSYKGNKLTFHSVDLTSDEAKAIEPGKYYLISGITTNTSNVYSHDYLQYYNPKNNSSEFADAPDDFTIKNEDGDEITFHGTYVNGKNIGTGSYALSGGKFYKYTDNPTIKGFRFWFTTKENDGTENQAAAIDLEIGDGGTTGISLIDNGGNQSARNNNVYTLDGRLVRSQSTSTEGLSKGLYIVNGKKVIVK